MRQASVSMTYPPHTHPTSFRATAFHYFHNTRPSTPNLATTTSKSPPILHGTEDFFTRRNQTSMTRAIINEAASVSPLHERARNDGRANAVLCLTSPSHPSAASLFLFHRVPAPSAPLLHCAPLFGFCAFASTHSRHDASPPATDASLSHTRSPFPSHTN